MTPRVLVVEDDAAVRGFLARALETVGCEAVGVSTGQDALQLVRGAPGVAIALIDGLLPDIHGARLAHSILGDEQGMLVGLCFVSGAIPRHQLPECGVGALSKPLRLHDFREVIEQLLAWREAGGSPAAQRLAVLNRLEQTFLVGP
ncbi:MAG: response regulator [Candidatus Dormibacteraeota bacterium]|nr:response regulator [Candidatus Dormibacteraeota bacterium]